MLLAARRRGARCMLARLVCPWASDLSSQTSRGWHFVARKYWRQWPRWPAAAAVWTHGTNDTVLAQRARPSDASRVVARRPRAGFTFLPSPRQRELCRLRRGGFVAPTAIRASAAGGSERDGEGQRARGVRGEVDLLSSERVFGIQLGPLLGKDGTFDAAAGLLQQSVQSVL